MDRCSTVRGLPSLFIVPSSEQRLSTHVLHTFRVSYRPITQVDTVLYCLLLTDFSPF